ncbi:MAG: hypothetical protein KKA54_14070 [Proteobacteria bacterium]|nr:hypothetical protein [Pseudomonadota bacterium]
MSPHPETVLAIDIGTSGARAALITSNGLAISSAQMHYGFQQDNLTGAAEMDAELVLSGVLEVINRCTAGQRTSVRCVTVAAAMHSLVLLDERGRPLTPLSIWMDTRATTQCEQYREMYEHEHWHQKTGCILSPSIPLARLLWYREKEPELFRRFSKAVSIKSYTLMQLAGACVEDHSVAAGSGLLNVQLRKWASEVLDYIDLDPIRLPALADTQDVVYHGQPKGVRMEGVANDTVWLAGGADGPLAHRASTGKSSNSASLTIGTSSAARRSAVDSMRKRDKAVWCYPLDSHRYVVGQASNNGGTVIDWCMRTLFPASTLLADLDVALRDRSSDPALLFIPFLHPERDCLVEQRPAAGFTGLQSEHVPLDLFQAALEGVVFNSINMLERLGPPDPSIPPVASGGVMRLDAVRRILSAVIPGIRRLPEGVDATLMGAAGLGWEYLGVNQEIVLKDAMSMEDAAGGEAYRQKYKIWKEKAAAPTRTVE